MGALETLACRSPLRLRIIESPESMATWVRCAHTKGQVDRAAELLRAWWFSDESASTEIGIGYRIIDNWRASHTFPLNSFQMNLRGKVRRMDPTAIVAQRLKRFSSVMHKLTREPGMKLSRMHDIGGCRAIVSDIRAVHAIRDMYVTHQSVMFGYGGPRIYDYIATPKADGYRGIHISGRYKATRPEQLDWDGHRIEIQIRSRLQHAFATAVETVTTFTALPLKFGGGTPAWRRFFSLMGSAIARREGAPPVPGTPDSATELVDELNDHVRLLRVRELLRHWSDALQKLPRKSVTDSKWFLLVLDTSASTIKVTGYSDRRKATVAYMDIEQSARTAHPVDAVLVSVGSIDDLRRAYPNYHADTREFISALDDALRPR